MLRTTSDSYIAVFWSCSTPRSGKTYPKTSPPSASTTNPAATSEVGAPSIHRDEEEHQRAKEAGECRGRLHTDLRPRRDHREPDLGHGEDRRRPRNDKHGHPSSQQQW